AINRTSGRAFSHIFEKSSKRMQPPIANANASPTIRSIAGVPGVVASSNHVPPGTILGGSPPPAVRLSQAPATSRCSARQQVREHLDILPAVAATSPSTPAPLIAPFREFQDEKPAE